MTIHFADTGNKTEIFKLGDIYGNEQEKHTVKNLTVSGESSGTLKYHLANGANVTTANLTDQITMEFHSDKDRSTIGTINRKGDKLVLANGNSNGTLEVSTLNQHQGSTEINTTNTIQNLNLYGGTIKNLILAGGKFQYYKGQVENITLVAAPEAATPQARSSSSSDSTTATLFEKGNPNNGNNSSTPNAYNGLITSVTRDQSGKNTATLNNGSTVEVAFNADAKKNGITIKNSIDDANKGIEITNNDSIQSLAIGTATQARSVRSAAPAAATATSSTITNGAQGTITNLTIDNTTLTNNGKIDKLTLNGTGGNKITNNPTYDGDGKAVNGTIKELVVSGGSSTINTLNGVAYDDTTGRSSITLQNGGNLKVETLDVGLRGNNAIARVQLNGNGSTSSGNGKLSAEWVQVSYVDGSFNPTAGLSHKSLNNYVTCNSNGTGTSGGDCSTRTEGSTKFRSSEGLREIGVLINEDGTSSFSVKDSLSADMTGLLIRQSMRRKMLLDTYLAEQSRRSLKNKERRTKQRIEATTLSESKEAYKADLAKYKQDLAKWEKLAATKENKALIAKYEQEDKAYQKALEQYQKDKAKWDKLSDKDKAKLAANKAPIAPKEPTKPAIIASKPEMPIKPSLHSSALDLYADSYGVKGDFFIRAFGSVGTHSLNDGSQTSSWSSGTLFGANWDLKLGNSQGNIGFYGGYEYLHNGYKRTDINAQGHTGFVGLRFSHLFARSKLAGFYYIADINGGYTDLAIYQKFASMPFNATMGNINVGTSVRLGSAVYLSGTKSMLFPSLGVGLEGGYIGEFEMKTDKAGQLHHGGLAVPYAVSYAQANLNYYQELGRKLSTTIGGGFRYLLNNEVGIAPTFNSFAFKKDSQGQAASIELAPFFYQGTFVLNYHTNKLGNLSAGYVVGGGGSRGITYNFSMRWHYFF